MAVEPPELEMRVAILLKKAENDGVRLDENVAFFIAKHIRSNVRELEGALKRVLAYARFNNAQVNVATAREALKDLLAVLNRQVSIENIQKTVADYLPCMINALTTLSVGDGMHGVPGLAVDNPAFATRRQNDPQVLHGFAPAFIRGGSAAAGHSRGRIPGRSRAAPSTAGRCVSWWRYPSTLGCSGKPEIIAKNAGLRHPWRVPKSRRACG